LVFWLPYATAPLPKCGILSYPFDGLQCDHPANITNAFVGNYMAVKTKCMVHKTLTTSISNKQTNPNNVSLSTI
jgi:hypothetical protein